jgi:hypothetical protein
MARATFRAKGQTTTPTTPTGMSTEQTPVTSPQNNISLYNVSLQPTQQAQIDKIVSPQNNFTAPYQSTSQFSRAGEPVNKSEQSVIDSILFRQRQERPDTYAQYNVDKEARASGFGAIQGYDPTDIKSINAQMEAQKAWEKNRITNVGYSANSNLNPVVLPNALNRHRTQSFLHAEIPRITYQTPQQKSLPTEVLQANSQLNGLRPSAPTPTKITRSVNLFEKAGQQENPLSVLEGNPTIEPKTQFLPQLNEIIVPKPAYQAFADSMPVGIQNTANMPVKPKIQTNEQKIRNLLTSQPVIIGLVVGLGILMIWKVRK